MKRDKIAKLSEVIEISPLELLGMDIPKNPIPVGDIVRIPVLGYITCGEPILTDENVTEYREVFNNDLPKGNLFFLQAKGHSMEPKIPDGSYVMLRKQPDVENGEIAAVIVNGDNEATLKRVRKLDDTILLETLNEKYAPYIINENNPARIIGKAVKVEYKL
ncbi:XRE family transcriptional regulator [Globicatella sp. HMSC072A10]|nr:XRE family transcriptional regulator [Globicatella sp. HMSC072A10]